MLEKATLAAVKLRSFLDCNQEIYKNLKIWEKRLSCLEKYGAIFK